MRPTDITPWDVLTSSGRYEEREKSDECTTDVRIRVSDLADRVSKLMLHLGIKATVSSGFRTLQSNKKANGAALSAHCTGEAVDLADPNNEIDDAIMRDPGILDQFDLYLESPQHTPGWSHLSTRRPRSGSRVFIP
jgi:hypothetical protein